MTSFFRKLNTLVQAQINDVIRPLSSDSDGGDTPQKQTARREIGRELTRDVAALRTRVNDALEYETTLQQRVDKLYADISRWDEAADRAVAEGREGDARYASGRLQQAQRDLAQAEDALREHQAVTAELANRVNYMDYVVNQGAEEQTAPVSSRARIPVDIASDDEADEDTESPVQAEAPPQVVVMGQAPAAPLEVADAPNITRLSQPAAAPAPDPLAAKRVRVTIEREAEETPQPEIPVTVSAPEPASTPDTAAAKKPKSKLAQKGQEEYQEGVALAQTITQKLDASREKLEQLVAQSTPINPEEGVLDEVKREIDAKMIDDDLSRRLARLSKPDQPS